jgi:hypothetical protein
VLLIVVSVALFPFRKAVAGAVVRLAAYVVWVLDITGRVIPQQVLWIFLLILILYIAVGSFYGKRLKGEPAPKITSPMIGPVEAMTRWIEEGERGTYFKWRLASLLGKIHETHQAFASRRETASRAPLPPPRVQSYLEAGVNTSYVDYPSAGPFQAKPSSPLDVDLEQVVEYLEQQMEIQHEQ